MSTKAVEDVCAVNGELRDCREEPIAAICKTFEDEEKLPFVIASGDAKTLWKELNKATRVAVKNM